MKVETTGSPYKQLKDNRVITVQNNTYAPEHETENHLVKAPGSRGKFIKQLNVERSMDIQSKSFSNRD